MVGLGLAIRHRTDFISSINAGPSALYLSVEFIIGALGDTVLAGILFQRSLRIKLAR